MAKQSRVANKVKHKHRAVKPRAERPLDQRKKDNHEDRHEAKKLARAVEAKQVEEAAILAELDAAAE